MARPTNERRCIVAVIQPVLLLPPLEAGSPMLNLVEYRRSNASRHPGPHICERSIEDPCSRTVRDAPGTECAVELVDRINRADIDVAAGSTAGQTDCAGHTNGTRRHGVGVIPESWEGLHAALLPKPHDWALCPLTVLAVKEGDLPRRTITPLGRQRVIRARTAKMIT